MVLLAIGLIALGVIVALFGFKLFRALLPIVGLVAGAAIGFSGIQDLFGTGVVSSTIGVLVAVVFGVVLAVLSYAFVDIALVVLSGVVFSSLFTFLGVALGLSSDGLVVGLLAISGFIIGVLMALSTVFLEKSIVTFVTAYSGVGFILAGIFLLSGSVTVDEIANNGIIASVAQHVNQSILWLFVWIAGAVVFRHIQISQLIYELFPDTLEYKAAKK